MRSRSLSLLTVLTLTVLLIGATAAAAQTESTDDQGIVIVQVAAASPAAQAGVKRGDILLSVAGQAVNNLADLQDILGELAIGDTTQLVVRHGDIERTLTVTVGERNGQPYLGVTATDDTRADATWLPGRVQRLAQPTAIIVEVTADSPAARAGLRVGDAIVAVDGERLRVTNDLASLISDRQPGDSVILELTRTDGATEEITVELGENPDAAGKAYLGVRYRNAGTPAMRMQRLAPPTEDGQQRPWNWQQAPEDGGEFYRNFPFQWRGDESDLWPNLPSNLQELLQELRSRLPRLRDLMPDGRSF